MSLLERIDIRPLLAFYNAEQNKRLIYHVALGVWLFAMVLCNTLLALFVDSVSRTPFYATLFLSLPVLYGLTHFLLLCFISVPNYTSQQQQAAQSTYSVESFGDHPHTTTAVF